MILNSNQPYLFYNNSNDICLLYCYAAEQKQLFFGNYYYVKPWKIRIKNYALNTDREVPTITSLKGYGDVIIECNPHIYKLDNKIFLNYICGFNMGDNKPIFYFFCSVESMDESFDVLLEPTFSVIQHTFTATRYDDNCLIYVNDMNNRNSLTKKNLLTGGEAVISFGSFDILNIYRIIKIYNSDKFIMTCQDGSNLIYSYILDSKLNIIEEIKNISNQSIYKCSVLGNNLIYTVRDNSDETENRYLVEELLSPTFKI